MAELYRRATGYAGGCEKQILGRVEQGISCIEYHDLEQSLEQIHESVRQCCAWLYLSPGD